MSFVDKLRLKVTFSNQINSDDESLEISSSTAMDPSVNHRATSPAFENELLDTPWVVANTKRSLIAVDIPVSCNDESQPRPDKDI